MKVLPVVLFHVTINTFQGLKVYTTMIYTIP